MNFIAFDVETANADPKSICQIGVAVFENGELKESWGSYVNPQTHFDFMNTRIHGITQEIVKNSPTLEQLKYRLEKFFTNKTVVTYTSFDQSALRRNNLTFDCEWLDASLVARRTWEKIAFSGYGLSNVCIMNKISMDKHHDAVSDAIAAGRVLISAMSHHNIDILGAKNLINKSIGSLFSKGKLSDLPSPKDMIIDGGNPEGKWYGEVVCFTGELSIPRVQAGIISSQKGFNVKNSVTKKNYFFGKGYSRFIKIKWKTNKF